LGVLSPTSWVVPSLTPSCHAMASRAGSPPLDQVRSPTHVAVVVPARQAYSHSDSQGSLARSPRTCFVNAATNLPASTKFTCSTGRASPG
jgi:hypothetical protein